MIGKLIGVVLILAMLIFSFTLFYRSMPGDPISLETSLPKMQEPEKINYGNVPVFAENMRFNHNLISYFIDGGCPEYKETAMINAFIIFARNMKVISFYRVDNGADADIEVGCSDDYIPIGEKMFAAGEGGPSLVVNTSLFKTIQKGKIYLYDFPKCKEPVVAIHELGHVFGFDHSSDPDNIMYNVSDCGQNISDDMIALIKGLYSIEALPEAVIKSVDVVKRGNYLDFNITVLNEGLIGIKDIDLTLVVKGEEFETMNIGEIDIGYGRTLRATNVRLPSMSIKQIDFVIDINNKVKEFNEDNNVAQAIISSQ
jgi:hypothetical protein